MKNIIFLTINLLLVFESHVTAQIVETHEFGTLNTQYYVYPNFMVTFKFVAVHNMTVKSVEVKSWLASNYRVTFNIELSIKDSLIAKWNQNIDGVVLYTEYFHTRQVSYPLKQGDTIYYKLGGTGGYPVGGLRGINYIKLMDGTATDLKFLTTPSEFLLSQNYPNPFVSSTTIRFTLLKADYVLIKVYNSIGKEVATLVEKYLPQGQYSTIWNATDFNSGVYTYRMQAGDFIETKMMVIQK